MHNLAARRAFSTVRSESCARAELRLLVLVQSRQSLAAAVVGVPPEASCIATGCRPTHDESQTFSTRWPRLRLPSPLSITNNKFSITDFQSWRGNRGRN